MKEKYESLEELLEDYTPDVVLKMINATFEHVRYIRAIRVLSSPDKTLEEIQKEVESYYFMRKK